MPFLRQLADLCVAETNNPQAHQPSVHQQAALPAGVGGPGSFGISPAGPAPHFPGGNQFFDVNVRYLVDKILADTRAGAVDTKSRLLKRIEADATALALSIAEYEQFCQREIQQHDEPSSLAPEASMDEGDDAA